MGICSSEVVDHVMMNAADAENESEDEYFGTGTDGNPFGIVDGMDADGYKTDTSQNMGAVSLINTRLESSLRVYPQGSEGGYFS